MKPSPNQLPLCYEAPFDERMNVFRAQLDLIDPADVDLTPTQWDRVCRLLRAVFVFACGEWGRYAQVDPERLQESSELSRRQVSDAKGWAREAGLLRSERDYPNRYQHRGPDRLWVLRERFDELVALSRAHGARVRNRAQPCSNRAQPGAHKETLSQPNSLSLSGRLGATKEKQNKETPAGQSRRGALVARAGRGEAGSQPDPSSIAAPDPQVALKFLKAIGGRFSARDAALAWKLAGLAGSVLSESWLWSIADGVNRVQPRPTKPWAYVWTCAANGSEESPGPGEERLKRLLARSSEPPPGWPMRREGPDFSQRMCGAAADDP